MTGSEYLVLCTRIYPCDIGFHALVNTVNPLSVSLPTPWRIVALVSFRVFSFVMAKTFLQPVCEVHRIKKSIDRAYEASVGPMG